MTKAIATILVFVCLCIVACDKQRELPEPWNAMNLPIEGARIKDGTKPSRFMVFYEGINTEDKHREIFQKYKKALEGNDWGALYQKHSERDGDLLFEAILIDESKQKKLLFRIKLYSDEKNTDVTLTTDATDVAAAEKRLSKTAGNAPSNPHSILGIP